MDTHQILQTKSRAHRGRILHVLGAAFEEGREAVDCAARAVLGEEGAAGRERREGGWRSAVRVDRRGGARDEVSGGRDACGQAGDDLGHVSATSVCRRCWWGTEAKAGGGGSGPEWALIYGCASCRGLCCKLLRHKRNSVHVQC